MRKWGMAVLALGLGLLAVGEAPAQRLTSLSASNGLGGLPSNSKVANTSNSPVTMSMVMPTTRFSVGHMLRRWRGVTTHPGTGRSYLPATSSDWWGAFQLRRPAPYGQ
jgi:hypothetical protein